MNSLKTVLHNSKFAVSINFRREKGCIIPEYGHYSTGAPPLDPAHTHQQGVWLSPTLFALYKYNALQ